MISISQNRDFYHKMAFINLNFEVDFQINKLAEITYKLMTNMVAISHVRLKQMACLRNLQV
jgi:hypothetical protein